MEESIDDPILNDLSPANRYTFRIDWIKPELVNTGIVYNGEQIISYLLPCFAFQYRIPFLDEVTSLA